MDRAGRGTTSSTSTIDITSLPTWDDTRVICMEARIRITVLIRTTLIMIMTPEILLFFNSSIKKNNRKQ